MQKNYYMEGRETPGWSKNMDVIGFHSLDGHRIFQMAMHKFGEKYYIYCAGRGGQVCPILDVTDPSNIRMVNTFTLTDPVETPHQSV